MHLSAPTWPVFLISLILAVLAVLVKYAIVAIPVVGPIIAGHTFEVLGIAYILIFLGVVLRRF
ncbi:hypothetical protein [Rhodobium gokarnense]|uniref:Uncharacterized protein n=1 Tax=Rhodobium gokarnense TaxID=364296 RepID=A0ABT3HIL2_9HYPH|nr:hypothetical protein [Rhodobium gokarnense]MCW2310169.1 hypothetical protein [Rhodobium gokarnense]